MSASSRIQIGHMAARSVIRTARQPELIAPALLFPLFLLAVNAGGLDVTTHLRGFPAGSYLSFALAITFMQGALFATTMTGVNLAEDIRTGFIDRLSLSPVRGGAILAAQLAGSTVLGTAQALVYIGVGLASGVTIKAGVAGALVLIALTLLITNAFASLGLYWALRTRSGEKVQALFPLLFAALFLSSLFLPRDLISTDWFRIVATYNPVSYMVEGIRGLIVLGWDGQALALAFGCASALLVASLAAAAARLGVRFPRPGMSRRSRSVALAVAGRHLRLAARSPGLLLPSILFPVLFYGAFAGGLAGIAHAPRFAYPDYHAFLFVFVLLQSAAFGGVVAGVALAGDLECGLVRRIVIASARREPILLGYLLATLVRAAVTTAVLAALALATGMRIASDAWAFSAVLLLATLVTVAATLFASGVAVRLRTTQAAPLMQVPIFLAMFLAPVYAPRELMTGWARAAAGVNPITLLLETGRGLLAEQAAHLGLCLGALVVAIAALTAWALRGLSRAQVASA